ncbi:liver-expressed antimicrobial peptide 2-like [Elgaria multicarinata webbii]|uniref:liver-expressed antimicrobial peptide 2-like n=1 Tax=Elgaria multicarinata webbii TaxID=159646 RepID=UPI002FCCF137
MARGLSVATWTALALGWLLLLLCSQQASAARAGGHILAGQERQSAAVPEGISTRWMQLLSRARRSSTPFWRTVGSKPLAAHCLRGLECSTRACRNGRCVDPHVRS